MNIEKKAELLLDDFEILKDNINNEEAYSESIYSIIRFFLEYDKYTAIEMWEYILEIYYHYNDWRKGVTQEITESIFCKYKEIYRTDDTLIMMKQHPKICQSLFGESICVDKDFFRCLLGGDRLFEFEEYINIVKHNKNFINFYTDAFERFVEEVVTYTRKISYEGSSLVNRIIADFPYHIKDSIIKRLNTKG